MSQMIRIELNPSAEPVLRVAAAILEREGKNLSEPFGGIDPVRGMHYPAYDLAIRLQALAGLMRESLSGSGEDGCGFSRS